MAATTRVVPMGCRKPAWKNQEVVGDNTSINLDDEGNVLVFIKNALSSDVVSNYISTALMVKRTRGTTAYGITKPRYEVFYTPDGQPYVYSGVSHATSTYPSHVETIIAEVEDAIASQGYDNMPHFGQLDITGDILYDDTLPCGGSVGAHADDEREWPIVVIFSLGQTRYLRIRDLKSDRMINVEMSHNSVLVMAGESFQKRYHHQVDRLHEKEAVGARLSLNIRYLRAKGLKKRRRQ